MGAQEFLREFFSENRTGKAILLGAIACFAAVATIGTFGIDLEATVPSVIYVVGIGIAFFLLVRFLDEPVSNRAATWFVALLIVGWIGAFFWSRLHPRNAELACAVYFWKPCGETADNMASASPAQPKLSAATSGDFGATAKAQYQVNIHFAGYARPTIVDLADALSKQGWNVEGRDLGGKRDVAAVRLAEVRYRDAGAKPAAEALAAALNASKISSSQTKAIQSAAIDPKTLEVWIGQR